jgi:dihydroorotase-like cyclic amidohydrolase
LSTVAAGGATVAIGKFGRAHSANRAARLGTAALVIAALIVAIAIVADGPLARALSGVGGLLWIAAGVTIANALRCTPRYGARLALCAVSTLTFVELGREGGRAVGP